MMKKYAQYRRFLNCGLSFLEIFLGSAIAFAAQAQVTETSHIHNGRSGESDAARCVIATPNLDLSRGGKNVEAGANREYTVSLTNNDDPSCSPSRFELTITYLPSGWYGELSTRSLELTPGGTGTVILMVSPASNTQAEEFKVQVAVSDTQVSSHTRTTMVTDQAEDDAAEVGHELASTVLVGPVAVEAGNETLMLADPSLDLPAPSSGGITLPTAAQERLPAQTAHAQQVLSGVIETLWVDYPDHAQRVDYLVTRGGRRLELQYTRPQRRSFANATVSVTGRLDGDYLALDPSAVNATGTTATTTVTGALPYTLGAQKLLVIPVKFQSDLSEPWTSNEISQRVFVETDAYYRDVSLDRTWFEGDVTPWVTINHDPTVCDPYVVKDNAIAEAARLGYDATAYSRLLYIVPALQCAWAGVAGVGGNPSHSWYRDIDFKTLAHELGHNFGLRHSHSAVCRPDESWFWRTSCEQYEYGDIFDLMGGSLGAAFNILQQRRLGYLDTDPAKTTTLVGVTGEYQIGTYAVEDSLSRGLRIPAGIDPDTGTARTLYVTRREPVGRDALLGGSLSADQNRIRNGVAIHIGMEETGDGALIDTTPFTQSGMIDFMDAPLLVGETYIDPVSGITVAPISVEPGIATVSVTLGTPQDPVPVPASNNPPVAVDDTADGTAGSGVEIPVLANDSDPDADPLVITYLGVPQFGSVSLNNNGLPVYRAPRKFVGTDTFSYQISDGVDSATANVTITVMAGAKGGGGKGGGGGGGKGRK